MKSTRRLLVSLAWALAGASDAQPLDGEYTVDFGYENAVWGPGSDESPEDCDETGCFSGNMNVDARGKVTGSLSYAADFTTDGLHVTGGMSGPLKGRVKGKDAVAQMKLTSKLKGALSAAGYPDLPIKGSLASIQEMNGNTMTSTVSGGVKLCVKGGGCTKDGIPLEVTPLDVAEVDGGPWTLDLLVDTDVKGAITGEALASFPDGSDSIHFTVKGKYNAKKGESSLKLVSDDPGPGATLVFTHVTHAAAKTTTFDGYQLKYKICGQSGQRTLP